MLLAPKKLVFFVQIKDKQQVDDEYLIVIKVTDRKVV